MRHFSLLIRRAFIGGACTFLVTALICAVRPQHCVVGEEIASTTHTIWPNSIAELLRQGLSKTDADSIRIWKESHDELVTKGEDAYRADLALALIYARGSRYEDMRATLMKTTERHPNNPELLRLLSWARLSDRQFTEGLKDIVTMIAARLEPDAKSNPADVEDAIEFAGEAFGFAEVAIKEVQPSRQQQYQDIRKDFHGLLPEAAKTSFAYAEDGMRSKVQQAIQETRGEQAENSEDQKAEKEARKQELDAQQQAMQAEAAGRQQQAAQIQQTAQAMLSQLQQQAQPLFAQISRLEGELNSLLAAQGREKENVDKKRFDPLIADVRGQISGVQSNLQPLIARYNQVEQTAMGQLRALGVRVRQLGRIHGANAQRLRANDAKNANGLTVKVSTELKQLTRLATYVPLDFEKETQRVLGTTRRGGLALD